MRLIHADRYNAGSSRRDYRDRPDGGDQAIQVRHRSRQESPNYESGASP